MTQSATKRCLDILELLAQHSRGLGVTEVCDELRIPKSVAHRLLGLLIEHRFVRQDSETARYAPTLKLTLLGLRYYAETGLSDISQPILDRLASETGELVRLAVVEGDQLVWVAKAQGARHGLRYDPDTGTHVVLHATATGKAWLSTVPEQDALRIVAKTRFETPPGFGPKVVRDIDRFRDELRATFDRGYGVAIEEGEPGIAAIAVAVRGSGGDGARAVGTLSIAAPVARFPAERRAALAGLLAPASVELSSLWPIRAALSPGAGPREAGQRERAPVPVSGGDLDHAT